MSVPMDKLWKLLQADYPNTAAILDCINKHPELCSYTNETNQLPINIAINRPYLSMDIIGRMIDCYPQCCHIINSSPQIPMLLNWIEAKHFLLHDILASRACQRDLSNNIVLKVIQENVDAIRTYPYPLLYECMYHCRYEIITKLLPSREDVAYYGDISIALHYALSNEGNSVDSILYLIKQFPDAAKKQNKDGEYPLHIECKRRGRFEIVSRLYPLYPPAISNPVEGSSEHLPLHRILGGNCFSKAISEQSSEAALFLIDQYPEAVSYAGNYGYLPLHLECNKYCRLDVIMRLIDVFPVALTIRNSSHELPLHCAMCSNYSNIDCILYLIDKCLDFVCMKDSFGKLPLHMECDHQCRLEVIIKLLEIYPEGISMTDLSDRLPLHRAVSSEANLLDGIMYIIDLYPEAVRMVDNLDFFPLHLECANHCRYDVIVKLLSIYPEAISNLNIRDMLPLHYAMQRRFESDVSPASVIFLINQHPNAACIADNQGNLPLHLACSNPRCDIIKLLLDIYPDAVSITNNAGYLPYHACVLGSHIDGFYFYDVLRLLLHRHPATAMIPLPEYNDDDYYPFHQMFEQGYYPRLANTALYNSSDIMSYKALAAELLNLYPEALYLPASYPFIDHISSERDQLAYRLLLNMACHHLDPSKHDINNYHDMNWFHRCNLLNLILQMLDSRPTVDSTPSSSDPSHSHDVEEVTCTSGTGSSKVVDALGGMLMNMLKATGRMVDDNDNMRHSSIKGDDLGCMLLRRVVLYL